MPKMIEILFEKAMMMPLSQANKDKLCAQHLCVPHSSTQLWNNGLSCRTT
jgi:hypothetical protein